MANKNFLIRSNRDKAYFAPRNFCNFANCSKPWLGFFIQGFIEGTMGNAGIFGNRPLQFQESFFKHVFLNNIVHIAYKSMPFMSSFRKVTQKITRSFKRCLFGLTAAFLPFSAQADDFDNLARRCAPSVAPDTLRAIVQTESSFNPYAIGVVGSSVKQPKSFQEAMSTIAVLEQQRADYSVGIAQINKKNFAKLKINAMQALDACTNLKAASVILSDCYAQAKRKGENEKGSLNDALSCYYSGNFKTGYKHGYVAKVQKHAQVPVTVPSLRGANAADFSTKDMKSAAPLLTEAAQTDSASQSQFIF